MSKSKWNEEADKFLRSPPIRSKFRSTEPPKQNSQLALISARRTTSHDFGSHKDRVLRAVFASFVDLFCESVPNDKKEHVRTELCSTLAQLHLVPNVFFSNEFASIRRSFSTIISTALGSAFNPSPTTGTRLLTSPSVPLFSSRYRSDFEEISPLGEGGFGTVHKVKSLIDNHMYAVKKIKLKRNLTALSLKVLNEVQVLAGLQHENVIRYHCGWVEIEPPDFRSMIEGPKPIYSPARITEITDDEDEVFTKKSLTRIPNGKIQTHEGFVETSTSEDDGSFASSDDEKPAPAGGGGKFWNCGDSTSDGDLEGITQSTQSNGIARESEDTETNIQAPITTPFAGTPVVYIQMELCSTSLEDHLLKRNAEKTFLGTPFVDGAFNREVCIQLLSAIEYIHSCNLIHRDIKPANIFMKPNGNRVRFLLGDFGLACEDVATADMDNSSKPKRRMRKSSLHSVGVGTTTYAAPEQLQSSEYGAAVDVYSAGIVLFEIYNVFLTSMERLKAIEQLRAQRKVPTAMEEQWPSVVEDVLKITDTSPSKRPSASQLLQKLKGDANSSVLGFKEIIRAKDNEIKALRAEVARLKLAVKRNSKS